MRATTDQPVAVRATAFPGRSRWWRRPVRRVRYDACWADGRIGFNVSLTGAMYRGAPADFQPVGASVHAHCPELGTGSWVDDRGAVVDGPAEVDPNPPGVRAGRAQAYGETRRELSPKSRAAWRLGVGGAALGIGTTLLLGPLRDGIAGAAGVLFHIGGLATLVGVMPGKRRWR
jgi:hypothetical protein